MAQIVLSSGEPGQVLQTSGRFRDEEAQKVKTLEFPSLNHQNLTSLVGSSSVLATSSSNLRKLPPHTPESRQEVGCSVRAAAPTQERMAVEKGHLPKPCLEAEFGI